MKIQVIQNEHISVREIAYVTTPDNVLEALRGKGWASGESSECVMADNFDEEEFKEYDKEVADFIRNVLEATSTGDIIFEGE